MSRTWKRGFQVGLGNPVSKLFLVIAAAGLISMALVAGASSKDDIVYPIRELGNCPNEAACRSYCDARDNLERARACIAVARRHNLLPPDALEEAERYVVRIGVVSGPGGCKSDKECEAYCEDTAHLDECLDFAERHGIRSAEEIAEGRKLAALLAQGTALPGGCRSKNACEEYCEDPAHMKACVAFAKQAGFISEKEAAEAEKIIPLIERGEKTPGNCGRKAQCEAYCENPAHLDECLAFAEKAGLMDAEELAQAKKFVPFIKRGETPGQCRGKAACEAYCGDTAHFEECVAFGERAGILSAEDAALARKTKGKGPGACQSREQCEAFCTDPAHQQECLAFAEEHGLAEEFSGVAAEMRTKLRAEADTKLRACAEKQCDEMIACLQGIAGESGQESAGVEGGGISGISGLPPDVQEKLNVCIAEEVRIQTERALQDRGAGEDHPAPSLQRTPRLPGGAPVGNAEEIEKRTREEEQQRQYDEEVRRQTEAEIKRQTEIQTKAQVDCSLFAAAPKCEYAAPVGSDNYNYCKQCFPDR